MDYFEFTVFGEGFGVGGEAGSVPTVVTGEFSGKIGWGFSREWAKVFDTIGAVPWATGGNGLGLSGGFSHGNAAFAEEVGGGGG